MSNEPWVIIRPVTETDPTTGETITRYVQESRGPYGEASPRRVDPRADDPDRAAIEIAETISRYVQESRSPYRDASPRRGDPQADDPDRAAIEIAEAFRRTLDEAEKERIRERLRAHLSEAFDQRRERQRREIEELERQLDSLRRLDAERQERKDDIVRRRMKQLLGEPDVLDWDPPSRQDLAFPFEGPRVPETSPPRSFDAPQTTDRRPSPDRRPGGEDETQPEPRRSRGTLRAENIEIELPDGPQGEAFGTAKVRAASAERILDLTEKIARNHRRSASMPENASRGVTERLRQSLHAESEGLEARLRLARLEWETVGRALDEDMKLAQHNYQHALHQAKRSQELFALGNLPSTELANRNAALTQAKAEVASAERRADAWKQMDQIVRQRAATLLDDRDEADEAPPRETGATESGPRRTESGLREATEDEENLEQADPKSRDGDRVEVEDTDQ